MGVAEAGVTGIVADTAGVAGTVAADTIAANTMAANTVAADTVTADSMTDTVTDTVTQTMALADHTVSLADHMGALAVDDLGLMHLHVHGHVLHHGDLHVLHHRHGHLDGLDDRVGVGHGVVLHVGHVVGHGDADGLPNEYTQAGFVVLPFALSAAEKSAAATPGRHQCHHAR